MGKRKKKKLLCCATSYVKLQLQCQVVGTRDIVPAPVRHQKKKPQTARTSYQFAVMRLAYAPPYIATSGLRGALNCNVIYDVNSLPNGFFEANSVDIQGADRLMEMADGQLDTPQCCNRNRDSEAEILQLSSQPRLNLTFYPNKYISIVLLFCPCIPPQVVQASINLFNALIWYSARYNGMGINPRKSLEDPK